MQLNNYASKINLSLSRFKPNPTSFCIRTTYMRVIREQRSFIVIHFNYLSQNIHPKSKIETNDFQRKSFMAAIKTNSVQGFFSFPAKQYFHCTEVVCWLNLRHVLDIYDLHSVRVHADVSSVSIYHSIFTALVVRRKLNLEEQLKLALRTIITDLH